MNFIELMDSLKICWARASMFISQTMTAKYNISVATPTYVCVGVSVGVCVGVSVCVCLCVCVCVYTGVCFRV